MSAHRWSGWPGAWCLDCGVECMLEIANADSTHDVKCTGCEKCTNEPCPCPGSNACNPYYKPEKPPESA